jgi:hypothetical protein
VYLSVRAGSEFFWDASMYTDDAKTLHGMESIPIRSLDSYTPGIEAAILEA